MLKLGEKIISDIYLGDKKIAKVFLGDKLVYQAGKPIFLDYIITDGNSYIDTEYCPNENTVIEYTWETIEAPTASYNGLFGSRVATSNEEYHVFLQNGLQLRLDFGRYAEPSVYYKTTLNTKYTIRAGLGEIYINDDLVKSYSPKIGQTKNSMYLGNFNNNGTPYTTGVAQKIYPCPIYENGVLVRNFKPCIAPNGQVAMYDEVNKKYHYGQGTGTLTAGNIIKFVDYIIFDGNSYIDTGIQYQTCTVKTETKFSLTGTRQLMGFSGASSIHYWGCSTSGVLEPLTSVSGLEFNEIEIAYNKDDVDNKTLTMTANGKSVVKTGKVDTTKSYLIGCLDTSSYFAQCEVKYNKIYANDKLIQDLKPCVVAGEAGFYDRVTGKIFTNAGTGTLKASGRFVTSILFDGASYIDTGRAHQTCDIECDIRFEETGTRQLMGFGAGTGQYWGAGASGTFDYMNGTNALDRTLVVLNVDTTDITITVNADGVTRKSTKGSQITQLKYRIGGAPTGVASTSYWCTCEVWSNKFKVDGVIVQDLRPYVDLDGVACFKDLVTGNLFYNKGTGTLTYTE